MEEKEGLRFLTRPGQTLGTERRPRGEKEGPRLGSAHHKLLKNRGMGHQAPLPKPKPQEVGYSPAPARYSAASLVSQGNERFESNFFGIEDPCSRHPFRIFGPSGSG